MCGIRDSCQQVLISCIWTPHMCKSYLHLISSKWVLKQLVASIYFKYYQGKVSFFECIKRLTEHSINTKTKILDLQNSPCIPQWARGSVFRTFASGLEAWRCLEDVLMSSSGLCHYQMKYFRAPWWPLQHVMFIKPQEDHPKTSPHDVCNWTGSMQMSWRRLDAFFGAMPQSNKIF